MEPILLDPGATIVDPELGLVVVSGTVVDEVWIVLVVTGVVVVVVELVVDDGGGDVTEELPPRADSTSAIKEPVTYGYRLSPGHVVLLMSR